jgi:hypothetical protein
LGLPVQYDGKKGAICIGKIPDGQIMSDVIKPYYKTTEIDIDPTMTMAGKTYYKGFRINYSYLEPTYSFNLEGNYNEITGIIGLDDEKNYTDAVVEFYGDGQLLAAYTLKAGSLPQKLDVNVKGVVKLDIKVKGDSSDVDLADLIIIK